MASLPKLAADVIALWGNPPAFRKALWRLALHRDLRHRDAAEVRMAVRFLTG